MAEKKPIPNEILMKKILAPVSLGELIDKITILQIKKSHLKEKPLENVELELSELLSTLDKLAVNVDQAIIERLKNVNQNLWNIEDAIRDLERQKTFGEDFIQLARSVYQTNDLRSAIKREINLTYHSTFIEEKSYQEY